MAPFETVFTFLSLAMLMYLNPALSAAIDPSSKTSDLAHLAQLRREVDSRRDFATLSFLALALHQFDRAHHPAGTYKAEAIDAYDAALTFDVFSKDRVSVLTNLIQLYEQQGRPFDAMRILQDTLEERRLDPFISIAQRSGLLISLGKMKRSIGDSGWMRTMAHGFALQGNEDLSPHVAYLLTKLDEEEFDRVRPEGAKSWSQHVDSIRESVLEEQSSREGSQGEYDAMKRFALFIVEDKRAKRSKSMEDKLQAWKWLERANNMMDAIVPDDLDATLRNQERIAAVFTGLGITATNDPAGRNIIFIVGLPRSGSTLVEQILQSHSQVSGLGEDTEFNAGLNSFRERLMAAVSKQNFDMIQLVVNEESERVLARSVESALNVKKSKIMTDKMLFNFINIGFIHMLFPKAKVVHTFKEDVVDAMFSLYKRQFELTTARWSYNWRKMQLFVEGYRQLMAHWHREYPGFVYDFPYERLIKSPEETLHKLLQYCELPWEDNVMDFAAAENRRTVLTHSADQVNQPLYSSAVGAWKFYEDFIMQKITVNDEIYRQESDKEL